MRSLLEHLEGHDAVLLMYLADELPAEDRARVEQMLASDPALAGRLEHLRAAQDAVDGAITRADAAHPLSGSEAAGVRQVGRIIRNWQAQRLAKTAVKHSLHGPRALRFPYWSYPLAAAAAVTVAFVTWYVNLPEPGSTGEQGTSLAQNDATLGDPAFPDPLASGDPNDPGDAMQFASIDSLSDSSGVAELETELRRLQSVREFMQ